MSATWYDVLGVDRSATTEEIRDAWKQSIADLEPTDGRFRASNQAAEVLLDPERRAEYDATLEPLAPAEPAQLEEPEGLAEPEQPAAPAVVAEPASTGPGPAAGAITVPSWLILALGLATLVVTAFAAYLQFAADPPSEDVETAITEAREAAVDAMPEVFSYNYKTPEADRDQALRRTTGCFHDELESVWDEGIMPNIREVKGHATSTVVTSGVVRASDDGDRVELLVVLDTQTGNKAGQNRLRLAFTVTMLDVDGDWLVERVKGEGPLGGGSDSQSDACSA